MRGSSWNHKRFWSCVPEAHRTLNKKFSWVLHYIRNWDRQRWGRKLAELPFNVCVMWWLGHQDQQQFASAGADRGHPARQHQLRADKNWQPLRRRQAGECQVRFICYKRNGYFGKYVWTVSYKSSSLSFIDTPSLWRGRSGPVSTLSQKTLWRSSPKWWWQSLPAWWAGGWSEHTEWDNCDRY